MKKKRGFHFIREMQILEKNIRLREYPVFSDKVLGDGVAIIPADVRSSNVICNGKNAPVVSDHYGVMITV